MTVVVVGGEPLGMAAARIAKVITTARLRMLENIVFREDREGLLDELW